MSPVGDAYAALTAAGELRADPDQAAAVAAIDRFAARLVKSERLLKRLLGTANPPGGLYLWGGWGAANRC